MFWLQVKPYSMESRNTNTVTVIKTGRLRSLFAVPLSCTVPAARKPPIRPPIWAKEILELEPGNSDVRAQTLWDVAAADFYQGKYDEALGYTDKLKSIDEAQGCYLKGQIYLNTSQYELARQELQRAKELDGRLAGDVDELLAKLQNVKQ